MKVKFQISFCGALSDAQDLRDSLQSTLCDHASVSEVEISYRDDEDTTRTEQALAGSLRVSEEAEPEVLAVVRAQVVDYENQLGTRVEFEWSQASETIRESERSIERYCEELRGLTNAQLVERAASEIMGAAVMSSRGRRGDWFDACARACHAEATRRGNKDLYQRAYNTAVRSQGLRDLVGKVTTPLEHGDPTVAASD